MDTFAWVLSGLLALTFLGAGGMKLATSRAGLLQNPRMTWVEDVTSPQVKTIGTLEVAGGVGLVLPWLLDVAPVLTPLAATGLAATMAGALAVHARRGELARSLPVVGLLLVLCVVLAVLRFSQL